MACMRHLIRKEESIPQSFQVLGTDESKGGETRFSDELVSEDLATVIADVSCCFHSKRYFKAIKFESSLKSMQSDIPCNVNQDAVIAVGILWHL